MEDLLVALEAANVTDIGIDIRNIGVLMFAEHPEKFLPCAQIELIRFNSPDAEGSDDFTEKIFTGPIPKQVRDALSYINATLIEEKVVKHRDRAEADRFFNYPYRALEEIIVNSVLHKSYRIYEPVEIRIYLDCIKVINHPGPERSINIEAFKAGRAISRRYRNRRIGEFLKEIDLSEKRSTGITKILRALNANGSPPPEFETNDERDYLIVTIRRHEAFGAKETGDEVLSEIDEGLNEVNEGLNEAIEGLSELDEGLNGVNEGLNEVINRRNKIISAVKETPNITVKQLTEQSGLSKATIEREIAILKQKQVIKRVGSKKTGYWQIIE